MKDARFELERAIVENELELHYQPIFDIDGRALRGVEALVRWRHPERGLVSPQAFLPTAEREGLMHDLTSWVLREALLQASVWRRDGLAVQMAVNLEMSDLRDDRFRRLIDRTLRVTAGQSALVAEIHADPGEAPIVAIAALRTSGVPVALDDVTSVDQLGKSDGWPLDALKLGRSLAGRVVSDARAGEIARSIANSAGARGLAVIAVGVEDRPTLEFARAIGCVGAQGYHLARPMTSTELRRWAGSRS